MSRSVAIGSTGASPVEAAPRTRPGEARSASAATRYFYASAQPLTALAFLLPLIVIYEVGTRWYASDPVSHIEQRIIAFSEIEKFFVAVGAGGRYLQYLPAGMIVAILLACHIARNDAWMVRAGHLAWMVIESALYALPLRALAMVMAHYLPLYPNPGSDTRALLVLSVGAGVYEEMIFRFVLFAVLSFLFIDLLRIRKSAAVVLILVISGMAFSLYHYLGAEPFEWRSFTFRTVAGIYFGAIFLWRGLGITAGAHAAYDISVFTFAMMLPR